MQKIAVFVGFLLVAAPLAAAQTGIEIADPWIRAPIGGAGVATAYATLIDTSGQGDTLTTVAAGNGVTASLHETTTDNGIMRMRPKAALAIPAGGSVELKTGAVHIMLMNVPKDVKAGDTIPLRLHFAHQGDVTVAFQVRP